MEKLEIFRTLGILFLLLLNLFFYLRERRWWLLLLSLCGVVTLGVNLFPGIFSHTLTQTISLVYVWFLIGTCVIVYTLGFKPRKPLSVKKGLLTIGAFVLVLLLGLIWIGLIN